MGFGHSGGHYSERTRTKQVADKVAKQLQSLLEAKKAAQKKPLELTHGEIKQAIANGADVLLSLHNDLLKSDTSTGYVFTKVTTAPKKAETIQLEKEYTIPRKIRVIQDFAFRRNTDVETIFIHSKIEKIGIGAFLDCKNLSAIVVDEENPYFCSEDGILYNKDKTCLIQFPANKPCTEFQVPLSVKEIAPHAFVSCKNLTSLILHDDIQKIGEHALASCGFTSIHIPAGMTIIEPYTFSCSKLTSVAIPSNIKTIADSAFIYSDVLSKVEFSQGLVRIEKDVFKGTKITEVLLPKSVKQLSKRAFGIPVDEEVFDLEAKCFYIEHNIIIKYAS